MNSTAELLNELHKATKAAIVGIDNLKAEINNADFVELLQKQNQYYESFSKRVKKMAVNFEFEPDDINIFMKAGSFMESKIKTMMDNSDEKVAKILINGTKMGIQNMNELIHEHEDANGNILDMAKEFKENLEAFLSSLKEFA